MSENTKKPNIFKKIKHWWKDELDEETRGWLKCVGIWTVDGVMIGSLITGCSASRKMKKLKDQSLATGYLQGQMDAYKEMAQNPYGMMDAGMRKLEMQGKAKKF